MITERVFDADISESAYLSQRKESHKLNRFEVFKTILSEIDLSNVNAITIEGIPTQAYVNDWGNGSDRENDSNKKKGSLPWTSPVFLKGWELAGDIRSIISTYRDYIQVQHFFLLDDQVHHPDGSITQRPDKSKKTDKEFLSETLDFMSVVIPGGLPDLLKHVDEAYLEGTVAEKSSARNCYERDRGFQWYKFLNTAQNLPDVMHIVVHPIGYHSQQRLTLNSLYAQMNDQVDMLLPNASKSSRKEMTKRLVRSYRHIWIDGNGNVVDITKPQLIDGQFYHSTIIENGLDPDIFKKSEEDIEIVTNGNNNNRNNQDKKIKKLMLTEESSQIEVANQDTVVVAVGDNSVQPHGNSYSVPVLSALNTQNSPVEIIKPTDSHGERKSNNERAQLENNDGHVDRIEQQSDERSFSQLIPRDNLAKVLGVNPVNLHRIIKTGKLWRLIPRCMSRLGLTEEQARQALGLTETVTEFDNNNSEIESIRTNESNSKQGNLQSLKLTEMQTLHYGALSLSFPLNESLEPLSGESSSKYSTLLTALRERVGISQGDFSERTGIPIEELTAWETGESKPLNIIHIIKIIESIPMTRSDAQRLFKKSDLLKDFYVGDNDSFTEIEGIVVNLKTNPNKNTLPLHEYPTISSLVEVCRTRRGITREKLSAKIKKKPNYIRETEIGSVLKFNLETVQRLIIELCDSREEATKFLELTHFIPTTLYERQATTISQM